MRDELLGIVAPFGVEAVGDVPQPLQHVEQVQDADGPPQPFFLQLPQRRFAVHQADQHFVAMGIAVLGLPTSSGRSRSSIEAK